MGGYRADPTAGTEAALYGVPSEGDDGSLSHFAVEPYAEEWWRHSSCQLTQICFFKLYV
jgi:hypothetical protein